MTDMATSRASMRPCCPLNDLECKYNALSLRLRHTPENSTGCQEKIIVSYGLEILIARNATTRALRPKTQHSPISGKLVC